MRFKAVGNKRDVGLVVVKNADTIPIFVGAPVFLAGNGTDDGLAVVSANNLAAASQGMFWGIATSQMAASGGFGESVVSGYYDSVRLRVTTRATSTDPWVSFPAGAVGDMLLPATGTGTVAGSVSADQAMSNAGSNAFSLGAQVRLGGTYASATTQATSATSLSGASFAGVSSNATAAFTTVKAFLRSF